MKSLFASGTPPPLTPDWSLIDLLRKDPSASAAALLDKHAVRSQLRRLEARETRKATENWWRSNLRRLSPPALQQHCDILCTCPTDDVNSRIIAVLRAMALVCSETRGVKGP